jgi:uncharacterized membrane protein
MKPRHFIATLDRKRIESAIHEAEQKTSGEIRVLVHRQPVTEVVAFAQKEFLRLGMQKTRERNAVLIFVAPTSQAFAVIGDQGVYEKCGQPFWDELAATLSGHFKQGDFTAGLLAGIARAGALLAEHFPPRPGDTDELPDQVIVE